MSSPRLERIVTFIVLGLSVVLLLSMVWAGSHGPIPTRIDDCAMVLERDSQQVCR